MVVKILYRVKRKTSMLSAAVDGLMRLEFIKFIVFEFFLEPHFLAEYCPLDQRNMVFHIACRKGAFGIFYPLTWLCRHCIPRMGQSGLLMGSWWVSAQFLAE